MVCPTCHTSFEGPGNFCPNCGAPIHATPPTPTYPPLAYPTPPYTTQPLTRVQRNLQVLTGLWAGFALYRLAAGLAGLFFLKTMAHGGMFGHSFPFNENGTPFLSALVPFALASTLVMVCLSALVAYSLFQRRPWGRTFSIVLSILSMLKFPFGTALGIYTLWVMAPAASAIEYDSIADRSRPGF